MPIRLIAVGYEDYLHVEIVRQTIACQLDDALFATNHRDPKSSANLFGHGFDERGGKVRCRKFFNRVSGRLRRGGLGSSHQRRLPTRHWKKLLSRKLLSPYALRLVMWAASTAMGRAFLDKG